MGADNPEPGRGGENEIHHEPEGEFDRAVGLTFNALIRVNLRNPRLISSELLLLSAGA